MRRVVAGFAFLLAMVGATHAVAGLPTLPDDENDYEGRVDKSDETYFGFDLNNDKSKASGFTTFLAYNCQNSMDTAGPVEVKGSLKVKNGKFDGVLEQKYTVSGTRQGPPGPTSPKRVKFVFDIKNGELEKGGKATGKIEAKALLTFEGGDKETCRATNDGKWKAKKGDDIDFPGRPFAVDQRPNTRRSK